MQEDRIAEFVRKRRPFSITKAVEPKNIKEVELPWYKKPILKEDFHTKRGMDGLYYAQHNAWSKRTWIGPYSSNAEADKIIESYIMESLKGSLEHKSMDSVHSVIIENENFFVNIIM